MGASTSLARLWRATVHWKKKREPMNICRIGPLLLILAAGPLYANDSVNSELSHVAGGAAMAVGFTVISDHYWSQEHRGWIGFGISASLGVLGELAEKARGKGPFSGLDAASNALGAAMGAFVTDQWILSPVVSPDSHYAGLNASYRF
jgi:hypothetical protein